jgi:hypothetical protein
MAIRPWLTRIDGGEAGLLGFVGLLRANPAAYGCQYVLDLHTHVWPTPLIPGRWVGWEDDGDPLTHVPGGPPDEIPHMPGWVRERTVAVDSLRNVVQATRGERPGHEIVNGAVRWRVWAGGLSVAEGRSIFPRPPAECESAADWYCTGQEFDDADDAEARQ